MNEQGWVLRCALDVEETVFRDVLVRPEISLMDLHKILLAAFEMDSTEIATVYCADDDWNPLAEFPMIDFEGSGQGTMESTLVADVLESEGEKLLWIADLVMMRSCFVEWVRSSDAPKQSMSQVLLSVGETPAASEELFVPDPQTEQTDEAAGTDGDQELM